MKQIRLSVFETNSSSCHSLSIFKRDEWDAFERGDSFVYMPYDVEKAKILSLEETRKIIIDTILDDTTRKFENLSETLGDINTNDVLVKEIVKNRYSLGKILGESYEDILDDVEIYNYDKSYGGDSEMYSVDEFDSYIFKKDYCVVVAGWRYK